MNSIVKKYKPAANPDLLNQFWQLPESAEDVQTLWSPNDLRSLTINTAADKPPPHTQIEPKKNAETLIYRTVTCLHALQTRRSDADFATVLAPDVLNCMRILTRLLPYIYEAAHLQDWEDRFFWQPRKPVCYESPVSHGRVYVDGLNAAKTFLEPQKDMVIGPPLGELLVDLLINYLFLPGFTLPAGGASETGPKPRYVVWQSGIGANKGAGMTKENEKNATEVLRLLLVLSSRSIYMAPSTCL